MWVRSTRNAKILNAKLHYIHMQSTSNACRFFTLHKVLLWMSESECIYAVCIDWNVRKRKIPRTKTRMIYMIQDMNLSALFRFNMCSVAYSLRIIVLKRQIIAPNHKVGNLPTLTSLFLPPFTFYIGCTCRYILVGAKYYK